MLGLDLATIVLIKEKDIEIKLYTDTLTLNTSSAYFFVHE